VQKHEDASRRPTRRDKEITMSTNVLAAATTTQDGIAPKSWMIWTGRAFTVMPTFMLLMSAAMKLTRNPQMIEKLTGVFGYPAGAAIGIGLLELVSTILYAIPRTAVLGAILVTGYLGGAIATHVRVGDEAGAVVPFALAVLAWGGLFLRDQRVRALLPIRD
jgi:hypothetical protein